MRILSSIFLLVVLILNSITVFPQKKKIDSLKKELSLLEQKTGSYTSDTSKVKLLNAITWLMVSYGNLDTALIYTGQALAISEKIKWNRGRAESYSIAGRVYRFRKEYGQSLANYQEALTIMRDLKEKDREASCLFFMGEVYQDIGNYPAALNHFLQALRLNEETGYHIDIARDLLAIGTIYSEIEDYPNALNYYQQGLKKYREVNNKFWIAISLEYIANIYKAEKEYAKALDYYSQVLSMQKGNPYSSFGTFVDLGDVYQGLSDATPPSQPDTAWEKAMDYYSRGAKVATEVNYPLTAGAGYNGMASLYLKKNKLTEAEAALNITLKYWKDLDRPFAQRDMYYNLSKLDSARGDWQNSLKHFRLYTAISDSLFNKKKSHQMAQAQIKYETDKKQGEIGILNKDNELKNLRIKQQGKNILLIASIAVILLLSIGGLAWYRNKKMKQEALKQISEAKLASLKSLMDKHFIFSSLHSIDTFLMNNDAEAASDYLVKYSKLIRSILEMSYQPEVSLEEEVSLCKSYLDLEKIRLNHTFDYEFLIDPNISTLESQFPSMLLQPLVENAVKHGIGSLAQENSSRKGIIKIDVNRIKDKIVCTVTDNGKGLQFSDSGTKTHRSYSGKGIIERVRVYNTLRKNKASFLLKDNNPGVSAVLTLPYISRKQSIAV